MLSLCHAGFAPTSAAFLSNTCVGFFALLYFTCCLSWGNWLLRLLRYFYDIHTQTHFFCPVISMLGIHITPNAYLHAVVGMFWMKYHVCSICLLETYSRLDKRCLQILLYESLIGLMMSCARDTFQLIQKMKRLYCNSIHCIAYMDLLLVVLVAVLHRPLWAENGAMNHQSHPLEMRYYMRSLTNINRYDILSFW